MRIANDSIIRLPSVTVSVPYTSLPIYVGSAFGYSVQVVHTTTSGNYKLQCSSDAGKPLAESWTTDAESKVTNWTDIVDSAVTVSEAGDITWDVSDLSYRWIRLVAVGNGTIISARFNLKGN